MKAQLAKSKDPSAKSQAATLCPLSFALSAPAAGARPCLHRLHKGDRALTVNDFGICRSRPDGLNLYCKTCIRLNCLEQRAKVRQMRAAQGTARGQKLSDKQLALEFQNATWPPVAGVSSEAVAALLEGKQRKPMAKTQASPQYRVLAAIHCGSRTQKQIREAVKPPLCKDEVADAICRLLLWTGQIHRRVINGENHYLPVRAESQSEINNPNSAMAAPFPINNLTGFHTIGALMPDRITDGERKAS